MEIVQYSLPQRQDRIKQLRESGTSDYEYPLSFQGQQRIFPVFTVEIGLPCYRLQNGRTRAAQLEVIANEGLPTNFFSVDPDSEPALKRQDKILQETVTEAGLYRTFKKVRQDQPLILDNDGYIINGNRRVCAMRMLLQQDEAEYGHFKHAQVIFLPPCSERDIKELEGRLQVQPDIRADYSWTAEAMLYRDLRNNGWTDEQIADLYQNKVSDIRDLIAMLEDAEYYLSTRSNSGKYSKIVKEKYVFIQLQKCRKKCTNDEARKQVLTNITYLMLDDPDKDGRLYQVVPDTYKYLDNIAENVRRVFPGKSAQSTDGQDNFDILGGNACDVFADVVRVLSDPENESTARAIIHDTIEEMRAQDRERKDATYCYRQVQQAYTKLQSALSALDGGADTTGIDDALKNIEQTLSDIRDWLSNANNQA